MEQRLMALWRYDNPPYYLAGEVTEVCSDGCVKINGFDGMVFKPVVILPFSDEKITSLKMIENRFHSELKSLSNSVRRDAEKLFNIVSD